MATVGDMVDLFDALFGKGHESFNPNTKIRLLNLGKTEFWNVLVGPRVQENWFVVESQSSSSGADDYFPPMAAATREYAMPPNFHQLRSMHVTTSGYTNTRFDKSAIDNADFIRERNNASQQWATEVMYDIIGIDPGTMIFSTYPPAVLTVKLFYTRRPTEWTALSGTGPDEFPDSAHSLIAEWAAKRALLGLRDKGFGEYAMEWQDRVERWTRTFRRDTTESSTVIGFME